jgi:hypothetical protein
MEITVAVDSTTATITMIAWVEDKEMCARTSEVRKEKLFVSVEISKLR